MTIKSTDKIYVAGHRSLAGSTLVRRVRAGGFENLVVRSHVELELTDQAAVRQFFERERPDHVIVAAVRVGGILANQSYFLSGVMARPLAATVQ